jgi:hypothetical protein
MWLAGRLTRDDPSVCQACALRYATQYGPHNVGWSSGGFWRGPHARSQNAPSPDCAGIDDARSDEHWHGGRESGRIGKVAVDSLRVCSFSDTRAGRDKAIGLMARVGGSGRPAPDTGPAVESSRARAWAFAPFWQRIVGPFGVTPSQANAAHGVAWPRWRVYLISKGRSAVRLTGMAFRRARPLMRAVRMRAGHLASDLKKYGHRAR